MISIQNHLRNEGLVNLFDGRSVAPAPKVRLCDCDCATPCPNGKTGMQERCIIGAGSGCSKTEPPLDLSKGHSCHEWEPHTLTCTKCGAPWVAAMDGGSLHCSAPDAPET